MYNNHFILPHHLDCITIFFSLLRSSTIYSTIVKQHSLSILLGFFNAPSHEDTAQEASKHAIDLGLCFLLSLFCSVLEFDERFRSGPEL
jgi:hypothetical protein